MEDGLGGILESRSTSISTYSKPLQIVFSAYESILSKYDSSIVFLILTFPAFSLCPHIVSETPGPFSDEVLARHTPDAASYERRLGQSS